MSNLKKFRSTITDKEKSTAFERLVTMILTIRQQRNLRRLLLRNAKQYGDDSRKVSADLYIDGDAGWVFWPLVWLKILWMETRK